MFGGVGPKNSRRLGSVLKAWETGRLNQETPPEADALGGPVAHYIGKTATAIPAVAGDICGYGLCDIYQLKSGTLQSLGYSEIAWNLGSSIIPIGTYVRLHLEPNNGDLIVSADPTIAAGLPTGNLSGCSLYKTGGTLSATSSEFISWALDATLGYDTDNYLQIPLGVTIVTLPTASAYYRVEIFVVCRFTNNTAPTGTVLIQPTIESHVMSSATNGDQLMLPPTTINAVAGNATFTSGYAAWTEKLPSSYPSTRRLKIGITNFTNGAIINYAANLTVQRIATAAGAL